jgi:hypothetical protein
VPPSRGLAAHPTRLAHPACASAAHSALRHLVALPRHAPTLAPPPEAQPCPNSSRHPACARTHASGPPVSRRMSPLFIFLQLLVPTIIGFLALPTDAAPNRRSIPPHSLSPMPAPHPQHPGASSAAHRAAPTRSSHGARRSSTMAAGAASAFSPARVPASQRGSQPAWLAAPKAPYSLARQAARCRGGPTPRRSGPTRP